MLHSDALYNKVLPPEDGYPSLEDTSKANYLSTRREDNLPYVRIKTGDCFQVRLTQAMPWIKQLNSATKKEN